MFSNALMSPGTAATGNGCVLILGCDYSREEFFSFNLWGLVQFLLLIIRQHNTTELVSDILGEQDTFLVNILGVHGQGCIFLLTGS